MGLAEGIKKLLSPTGSFCIKFVLICCLAQ